MTLTLMEAYEISSPFPLGCLGEHSNAAWDTASDPASLMEKASSLHKQPAKEPRLPEASSTSTGSMVQTGISQANPLHPVQPSPLCLRPAGLHSHGKYMASLPASVLTHGLLKQLQHRTLLPFQDISVFKREECKLRMGIHWIPKYKADTMV